MCAGIFLCQLLYWRGKQSDPDGWIYKTQAEITDETGLSRCEQETARKLLREKGLIKEKFADVPRKLYFYVCIDEINGEWMKVQNSLKNPHNADWPFKEDEKTLKNPHSAENQHYIMQQTSIIECGNPALNNAENQQANTTETTTETTTKNITKNIKYSLRDSGKDSPVPTNFIASASQDSRTQLLFKFSEEKPAPKRGKEGRIDQEFFPRSFLYISPRSMRIILGTPITSIGAKK